VSCCCGEHYDDAYPDGDQEVSEPIPPRHVVRLYDNLSGEVIAEAPVELHIQSGDMFVVTMRGRLTT
jgi:hypothetical protein